MTISYPLSIPSVGPRRVLWNALDVVGESVSPFSLSRQTYDFGNDLLGGSIEVGELSRTGGGEDWAAFIFALRGRLGTFYLTDPLGATPRGTWSGAAPKVNGAHSARARVVALKSFNAAATIKAGDWIQFGSTSSSRLHKVLQDATADGSGNVSIDIWPCLRAALANNDTFVTSSAKGVFCLTDNARGYSIEDIRMGGISLGFRESF